MRGGCCQYHIVRFQIAVQDTPYMAVKNSGNQLMQEELIRYFSLKKNEYGERTLTTAGCNLADKASICLRKSLSKYSNNKYKRSVWRITSTNLFRSGRNTQTHRHTHTHMHSQSMMIRINADFTMFGCCSSFRWETSRIAELGTPSSSLSRRIFLSAKYSLVSVSRTLYTTPNVPSPIFSIYPIFFSKNKERDFQPFDNDRQAQMLSFRLSMSTCNFPHWSCPGKSHLSHLLT